MEGRRALVLLALISCATATPQLRKPAAEVPSQQPQSTGSSNSLSKTGSFTCTEDFGDFEDPLQCDKYWKCDNGRATAHYCDDGLVFDTNKAGGRIDLSQWADPCDSPYVVDCGNRVELQEPTFTSEFCPRRHGFFADPDPSVCGNFYTCIKGQHTRTNCAAGLHFDEKTGTCAWPSIAQREGCQTKPKETVNGFACPAEEVLNDQGVKIPHPTYPNLDDCQKFYVCLNGETPQEAACNLGKVFNEKSMQCEYPESVPECDGWYKNDPRFADYYDDTVGGNAAADPGAQDVAS